MSVTDLRSPPLPGRPLLFGEVLFDCFSPDRRVIGGAPFNVTWNLQGFGLKPLFLSAVGDDPLGREALETARNWGLETRAIEVFAGHPTGRVDVHNAETDPTYIFQEDCAWDHLSLAGAPIAPDTCALLYHGSLAVRSEVSHKALMQLREGAGLPIFVDLNLRPPHFDREKLPDLIRGATWLKLNEVELADVCVWSGLSDEDGIADQARALAETFDLAHLLVTAGSEGAYWITRDQSPVFAPAPSADPFVDSVGAGDAFASVVIQGILEGAAPEEVLNRAVAFAARVCGLQGATSQNPDFYQP